MKTRISILLIALMAIPVLCAQERLQTDPSPHDLEFKDLAASWDEGMPLGNAVVGALVWQKEGRLRFSLDRIDLWDLRPTEFVGTNIFRFKWVKEQLDNNNYGEVNRQLDGPYDQLPAPSKIPGAGLEFDTSSLGEVESNRLCLKNAVCEVRWKNGAVMQTFVHAYRPLGWFLFEGVDESFVPVLVPPRYQLPDGGTQNDPVTGASLARLDYKQGTITTKPGSITYRQVGWKDFSYEVSVRWVRKGDKVAGVWSVTSSLVNDKAEQETDKGLKEGGRLYASHLAWWKKFWAKSAIEIPDPVLEKQYYNEIYKFGSIARKDGYPISLQAVWTADNGNLPPWKGDFHHDLNTQLSYWPAYTGNYLEEGYGYLNTLWSQREVNRAYTKTFFGAPGINVPGVATLHGNPMGGWVQYSCSPTVSAWLAQHFHLHWVYSQDREFLKNVGYPYLKEVATFLKAFSHVDKGVRKLPLSSSPEIHDNSARAWFRDMTNYDLALMKFAFEAAADMAGELGKTSEAREWKQAASELPPFDVDAASGLTFAPGEPYASSHRHFSHAMAIHPLGLIDWSQGDQSRQIITNTIASLDRCGPRAWVGYSYSWLGNMKARAMDGEGAATALRDFAQCFCLRNTFHVNGDQSGTGKSGFRYRPFTLEGNFAFASGVQDMLIQSHTGVIRIFPAIPSGWKDASFSTLRTRGAFLVSAERKDAATTRVVITSERGGACRLANPFGQQAPSADGRAVPVRDGIIEMVMQPGQTITLVPVAG